MLYHVQGQTWLGKSVTNKDESMSSQQRWPSACSPQAAKKTKHRKKEPPGEPIRSPRGLLFFFFWTFCFFQLTFSILKYGLDMERHCGYHPVEIALEGRSVVKDEKDLYGLKYENRGSRRR
jgi:hypothetical protein